MNSCPLFIFASATIDIEQMVSYYFSEDEFDEIVKDPCLIGDVTGSSNYPIQELFLTPTELNEFNSRESTGARGTGFAIIGDYFTKHIYPQLYKSKSIKSIDPAELPKKQQVLIPPRLIEGNKLNIPCRDALIFVPLVSGIDVISNVIAKTTDMSVPTFVIHSDTTFGEVVRWRIKNKNKRRVLIVGFASGFSQASDEILSKPFEPDVDVLLNELKIIISTPAIETGKTISTLYFCVDMGLNTTMIANPLVFDFNETFKNIKQIPINMNQCIQRMGRIGREAPGSFLHFYTREIMQRFKPNDVAETINSSCLSNMLMSHIKQYNKYTQFDVVNENNYLYPATVDNITRSMHDMIHAGIMTVRGEYVNIKTEGKDEEIWIMYAAYLYYILKYSLFESLMLAACNRKTIPQMFNVQTLDVKKLKYSLDSIKNCRSNDQNIIEGILLGRNYFTLIKYGHKKQFLRYLKNREYKQ